MPADDDLIEAAPCPNCRSPLTVAVADLGHLVECPGCGTQFRARRPGSDAAPPPPPPRREGAREERREDRWGEDRTDRDRRDRDEVDDRPRRSSGRATGRDRYFEGERDRDRGYDSDERYGDDRYEDRRRRPRPGAVTALAVMHFVYAGLLLLCGIIGSVGLAFGAEFVRAVGGPEPNWALEILGLFSYFATGLVALFAGVFALQRKGYGLSVAAVALACVSFLLGLVSVVVNAQDQAAEGPELVCGFVILAVFWLGYIVTNGILVAKTARHFR